MSKKLSVYFDASSVAYEIYTGGIGVYLVSLAKSLLKSDRVNLAIGCKPSRLGRSHFIRQNIGSQKICSYPIDNLNPFKSYQVYHGPDFKVPKSIKIPKVVTVHDLVVFDEVYADSPFAIKGRKRFDKMITKHQPDQIIAISEYTKTKLIERYPDLEDRVTVIYHGADHFHLKPKAEEEDRVFDFPYIFYAGAMDARKNVVSIVKSFEIVASNNQDLRLVLCGREGFRHGDIMSAIKQSRFSNRIIYEGFIDNNRLNRLFEGADLFIFPSLIEGFGFPILESMSFEVPVITSSRGAMKEVASDAAWLVDPLNVEEIANGIHQILSNQSLKDKLICKGRERVRRFTWEKCAKETIDLYSKMII